MGKGRKKYEQKNIYHRWCRYAGAAGWWRVSDYEYRVVTENAAKRNPQAAFFINMGDIVDNGFMQKFHALI